MAEPVRESDGADLEARLARIDAGVGELLDLWSQGSDRRDELGRALVEERARNLELQRKEVPIEKALVSANARIVELERALAVAGHRADAAERDRASLNARMMDLERALALASQRADEATKLANDHAAEQDRARARITGLEAQLADALGELAEREHATVELQQALRHERELRTSSETERDRLRQFAGFLRKSRWRQLGKAIGVVKTPDWERTLSD
jgi:chromosome segregation ATPase